MTKLFSMKSVAFAGAAAFALALAAAPQADAAEAGKPGIAFEQKEIVNEETITKDDYDAFYASHNQSYGDKRDKEWVVCYRYGDDEKNNVYMKYTRTGKYEDDLSLYETEVLVSKSAVTIAGGKLEYYYSSAKKGKEPKKWTAVSTNYDFEGSDTYRFYVPVRELAKDKEVDIYISADAAGELKTDKIACNAAPKIKVAINNLSSGPSIKITDKNKADLSTGYVTINSQYGGFYDESTPVDSLANGTEGAEWLMEALQAAADMGGATFEVNYESEDEMTPVATAKLKVAATPKAPKVSLKLAKTFSLKLKDNIKYRVFTKENGEPEGKDTWLTGSGQAMTINGLFKDYVRETPISSEFVLNETMELQAKTIDKKGKKVDSRISTTTIYKSAATPGAVNAVITSKTNTKKSGTTTDAAIEFKTAGLTLSQDAVVSSGAVVTLQYNDGKKWKDVKGTSQTITFKSGKIPDKIYVRVKGVDYKAGNAKKNTKTAWFEAPGCVMTINMDKNDPASSTYSITSSAISLKTTDINYNYEW